MREHGAVAVQQFGEDFLPLILLFAISVTGLMLTASYTWMKGYAYDFLAILHAATVIDDDVAAELEQLTELAPLHQPPALDGIRRAREALEE